MTALNRRKSNRAAELFFFSEITSAKSGLPSKHRAKRDSATTEIRKSGNSSLSARTGLVSNRQSPMERRRIRRIRAFRGSWRNRSLVFNLRFADHHDGDVVTYWIHAMAFRALQPLSAVGSFKTCFAKRANKYLQQFRIHGHSGEMVARGIPNRGVRCVKGIALLDRRVGHQEMGAAPPIQEGRLCLSYKYGVALLIRECH